MLSQQNRRHRIGEPIKWNKYSSQLEKKLYAYDKGLLNTEVSQKGVRLYTVVFRSMYLNNAEGQSNELLLRSSARIHAAQRRCDARSKNCCQRSAAGPEPVIHIEPFGWLLPTRRQPTCWNELCKFQVSGEVSCYATSRSDGKKPRLVLKDTDA